MNPAELAIWFATESKAWPSRLRPQPCSLDFARHDYFLVGNVGCLFAAIMNAIPITIRKNEKNWPRVNAPINSASGSRKFSTTIRKIA
jgi:hypothetical protein